MDDFDAASSVAFVLAAEIKTDFPRGKRAKWSKRWFPQFSKFGHTKLLCELRHNEPQGFQNFLCMNFESYNELLRMVGPLIRKQTTNLRKPISPMGRLSITLHYLALGHGKYF